MRRNTFLLGGAAVMFASLIGAGVYLGCSDKRAEPPPTTQADTGPTSTCPGGTDADQDTYGVKCPAGPDCDDQDVTAHPGATEICDNKDNNCDGKVDEGLSDCVATLVGGGDQAFPTDKSKDPNVGETSQVSVDGDGNLTLASESKDQGFVWLSNTDDFKRGTISKVDTRKNQEVARYLTVTCHSQPGATSCVDVEGRTITPVSDHTPSRTAVDLNMDVWVANRCLTGCQPSATKIANDPVDCIDRNQNSKIDTSKDQDGDGKINADCDGNGEPDTLATVCTGTLAGKTPEFLGDDDECILFTTNIGDPGDIARAICLSAGKATLGPSAAWVGTYARPEKGRGKNLYYHLNGKTGKIENTVALPLEHHAYGCVADGHRLIWSTDIGYYDTTVPGSLTYFEVIAPNRVGTVMRGPTKDSPWTGTTNSKYRQYGIAIDPKENIWLAGIDSRWVLRYRPDRTSFETLDKGTWTRIDTPTTYATRGIATDARGKVWVALNQGYIARLDQDIPDGVHDKTGMKLNEDYWPVAGEYIIGVAVDMDGNVWAIGRENDTASRLDVDDKGNVISPPTGTLASHTVKVGTHPYTYSDFTGYGLFTIVQPEGRWSYVHKPCPQGVKTTWKTVSWNALAPTGTSIILRVRSGESASTMGAWSNELSATPAEIAPGAASALSPNPATLLEVEFTLRSQNPHLWPVLRDYSVSYKCVK